MVAALREEVARLCCQEPQVVLIGTAPDRTSLSGELNQPTDNSLLISLVSLLIKLAEQVTRMCMNFCMRVTARVVDDGVKCGGARWSDHVM